MTNGTHTENKKHPGTPHIVRGIYATEWNAWSSDLSKPEDVAAVINFCNKLNQHTAALKPAQG